jgi:hypothetical protein
MDATSSFVVSWRTLEPGNLQSGKQAGLRYLRLLLSPSKPYETPRHLQNARLEKDANAGLAG